MVAAMVHVFGFSVVAGFGQVCMARLTKRANLVITIAPITNLTTFFRLRGIQAFLTVHSP